MKIVKISVFRSPNRSPGKGVVVFEDSVGWLYLKALVEMEGYATPFSSMDEVEVYVGEPLTLYYWLELDDTGETKSIHYADSENGE